MSAVPARCGATTASGGACRRKVSSEGERCALHREAQAETTLDPSGNAITHGITSPRAIVPGETAEAWAAHLDGFRASLAPVGELEGELADRVALLSWRLRRVVRYESAGIAASLAHVERRRRERYSWGPDARVTADEWREAAEALRTIRDGESLDNRHALGESVAGNALASLVEAAGRESGEVGPIDWPGVSAAKLAADGWADEDHESVAYEYLAPLGGWTVARIAKAAEAVAQAGGDTVPDLVWGATLRAIGGAARREIDARDGADAYAAALGRALLPDDSTLDKITRYESHLHRLMLATLRELEALQKLRTGQDAPLARLDVTGAG